MADKRINFGVGVIHGFIYVVGGHNGETHLSSVEQYNPTQETWTTVASMNTTRTGLYNFIYGLVNPHSSRVCIIITAFVSHCNWTHDQFYQAVKDTGHSKTSQRPVFSLAVQLNTQHMHKITKL